MDLTESKPWVILTTRYGSDIRDPSTEDLSAALNEIYDEDIDGATEAYYAEHPNAWLRRGFDDGPMYVLDVYRGGRTLFGQWADQDFENESAPETVIEGVDRERGLQLWSWLASGDIERIKQEAAAPN